MIVRTLLTILDHSVLLLLQQKQNKDQRLLIYHNLPRSPLKKSQPRILHDLSISFPSPETSWLVVYLPLWKICSSIGMMTFPSEWKVIKAMVPVTTNQSIDLWSPYSDIFFSSHSPIYFSSLLLMGKFHGSNMFQPASVDLLPSQQLDELHEGLVAALFPRPDVLHRRGAIADAQILSHLGNLRVGIQLFEKKNGLRMVNTG